jgi:hypothetical protein
MDHLRRQWRRQPRHRRLDARARLKSVGADRGDQARLAIVVLDSGLRQ